MISPRFIVIFLLRSKNEVTNKFKEYYAGAKARFNCGIIEIRCNNGGEYINQSMKDFCKLKGIRLGLTVPYTP